MFKQLVIAVLLLVATATATHSWANNVPVSEQTCTLPAPGNLHVTNVGPTNLSFAWNSVLFSAGYDYELRIVATNQLISYGHTNNLYYAATALAANTVYEFKVWSICPTTNERGGVASRKARTDYIVIGDIEPQCNGNIAGKVVPQITNLFSGGVETEVFMAQFISGGTIETKCFNVLKIPANLGGGINPNDQFLIKIITDNNVGDYHDLSDNEWAFGNEVDDIPLDDPLFQSSVDASYCKIFYRPVNDNPAAVMNVYAFNNFSGNGTATFKWEQVPGMSMYNISWLSAHNFSGPGGGTVNKQLVPTDPQQDAASNAADYTLDRYEAGQSELNNSEALRVMPNPFDASLTLIPDARLNQQLDIRLLDMNGRVIITESVDQTSGSKIIPTEQLSSGIYILQYELDGKIVTRKVVKSN